MARRLSEDEIDELLTGVDERPVRRHFIDGTKSKSGCSIGMGIKISEDIFFEEVMELSEEEANQLLPGEDVLSPEEIDRLLTGVIAGDCTDSFENIDAFEDYLTKRTFTPDKPYGMFDKDITVCRFFESGKNENLLEDIKRKNKAQGYGNIKIPNTDITLINYSVCPHCKTIFSFKEVTDYYKNPNMDQRYKNRAHQYRKDTRICCKNCGTYFLPSLVISDGTPKNEVQFLCRVQTIDAIEDCFDLKNIKVLTKNKDNIIQKGALRAIKNDVYLKNLEDKPTLITNMIQYTPINLIMNLLDGTNIEKGDLLFDEWK
jgi:hypothetical protein